MVENRPGGKALVGADAVAKATLDGHTLPALTLAHAVNATLFANAPYDLLRDLTPVAALGSLPLVAGVNAASPARTLAVLARARPLNAGSTRNETPPHLALELFRQVAGAGLNITHFPCRGGRALAVTSEARWVGVATGRAASSKPRPRAGAAWSERPIGADA